MKQYHLTFFCNEQPQTTLFYIVRAENLEDAIKSIEYKVKKDFCNEYGRVVKYSVKDEYFDLNTYPLSKKEVIDLLESNLSKIGGDVLGRLIVWFNDQDIENITSILDKELLEKLEHLVSFPTEIRVDLDKLEKLRDINLKLQ
ncbi:hypothetical protein INP93_01140 [Haemophilus parainfluenzae]|uniref:hypothetical protein n=1 Tax=Haemophilus parainfluenzae TaxID=729 RepID=UPI0018A39F95|nr:hypothetical protein [Haemophilus parainfluenzae]QOR19466.1 hypothetical protein INP93_01140 [Haemophilus parainfluenzae]